MKFSTAGMSGALLFGLAACQMTAPVVEEAAPDCSVR